jgi:hypothetical protein
MTEGVARRLPLPPSLSHFPGFGDSCFGGSRKSAQFRLVDFRRTDCQLDHGVSNSPCPQVYVATIGRSLPGKTLLLDTLHFLFKVRVPAPIRVERRWFIRCLGH